jgi:hypothetical protein
MTSLALFLQECLTEEKYGSTFVSEIDQRLETLNYIQLTRMHEVISNAAKVAKMKTWKDGNNDVLQHVEKWLEIRKKEHDIEAAKEEEVLRRIRHKEKIKKLNEREKIRVIEQLEEKARKNAEYEIKHLEIQRKASYKEQLYQVVEIANKKRNYHIAFGILFLICGCVLTGLFLKSSIFLTLGVIGGIILITIIIFYRAYRVSQVAPYDDDPETIEKKIQEREEELFAESMEVIRKHEREYDEKMALDKMERKKRKQERRHREEILRYLENHPEIPINPEEGDVDLQLKEYLLKNDPNQRISDEKRKGSRGAGGVNGIEIIHERSREEDDEDDDKEEKEEEQREKGASPALSKEFGVVHADLPETSGGGTLRGVSSSSKYLLGESHEREEDLSSQRPPTQSVGKLQLHLLTLSQFLSSFLDTKPVPDVYLTLHWKQNLLETNTTFPPSSPAQETSQLLFQTDSQKCLGEMLLWRYENSSHDSPHPVILLPFPSLSSAAPHGYLSFEFHSTRHSSSSSDSLLASGSVPVSDLVLPPSHGHAKSGGNRAPMKQSVDVDLIRNDVIKVCHLSMEYRCILPVVEN